MGRDYWGFGGRVVYLYNLVLNMRKQYYVGDILEILNYVEYPELVGGLYYITMVGSKNTDYAIWIGQPQDNGRLYDRYMYLSQIRLYKRTLRNHLTELFRRKTIIK
jgi:hypothetical protein